MRHLKIEPWYYIKRDTPEILFRETLNLIKRNGHYDHIAPIIDYTLAEKDHIRELTCYEFDFVATVKKGGSEGIYIDCYLKGIFDDSDERICPIGTIKSLEEGVTGFRLMGELCGLLAFYSHQYVDENIDRYSSTSELEKQAQYSSVPQWHDKLNGLFIYPSYGTTKAWTQFLWQHSNRSFETYQSMLGEMIGSFESISSMYGKEMVERIYHNIHNSPSAGILPGELKAAAKHLQNGGNLDDLRWINRGNAEGGNYHG